MFIDKELLVSDEQDLQGIASTSELSTYSINLGTTRDFAKGRQLYAVIVCDEAVTVATSVQFQVVTSTAVGGTTAEKVLADTGAIAKASLTLGCTPIVIPIPPLRAGVKQQYLMIKYTTTGTPGAGKFTAFFGSEPQTNI